jgi:CubicO group peptidase (beta-lactamase class C family)
MSGQGVIKNRLRACIVLLATGVSTSAQVMPAVAPEQVGLSKPRLDRIRPAMEKAVTEKRLAGGVGLIVRRGKIAYFETYGTADREAGKAMSKDSIFRIFSMTKAVTAVAVMSLYEEGRFALTDPVARYLPEFTTMTVAIEKDNPAGKRVLSHTVPAERPITILDLLRHTSGLDYAGPHDAKGELIYPRLGLLAIGGSSFPLSEFVKKVAQTPLVHQPGTTWDYGLSIDVLGRLVEVVSGQTLDQFFADRILKPLRMDDTGFFVPPPKVSRLVALYNPAPDGTVQRAPDRDQEGARTKPVTLMGGAGLMSTASDYARFATMLLNGGELDGVRILSPKTVGLMRADVLGDLPRVGGILAPGYGFGLTFAVNRGPGPTPAIGSKGEYFWGGAAGTTFWIDPEEQMVGVFMMQTMLDLGTGSLFKQLAYQAIVDVDKK